MLVVVKLEWILIKQIHSLQSKFLESQLVLHQSEPVGRIHASFLTDMFFVAGIINMVN
jgi:hypothetical protein